MGLKPAIEEYLRIACQLITDEFNETYKYIDSKEQLRVIANEEFSQQDIYTRIYNTFKNKTYYKSNAINIKHKDFIINVHYLKNFKSDSGTPSGSKNWSEHKKKFDWLENEIRIGNKGKRAFVIGWFNCVERFSQVMQIGKGSGADPDMNDMRVTYFPFLKKIGITNKTKDLDYNYLKAYISQNVDLIRVNDDIRYDCLFLGSKEDKFHFAIYY